LFLTIQPLTSLMPENHNLNCKVLAPRFFESLVSGKNIQPIYNPVISMHTQKCRPDGALFLTFHLNFYHIAAATLLFKKATASRYYGSQ